jgi:hypothetical protein
MIALRDSPKAAGMDGCATWRRIIKAIEEMQSKERARTRPLELIDRQRLAVAPVGGLRRR